MPYKTGSWGIQAQERSRRRIKYFRSYQRGRYERKTEQILEAQRKWQSNNPLAVKAGNKANYHIQIPDGQHCVECKDRPAQVKHHPDYSKPLEVQFLCESCHAKKRRKEV